MYYQHNPERKLVYYYVIFRYIVLWYSKKHSNIRSVVSPTVTLWTVPENLFSTGSFLKGYNNMFKTNKNIEYFFISYIKFTTSLFSATFWYYMGVPSLNELTLMISNTGLTHLGSEASKVFMNSTMQYTIIYYHFFAHYKFFELCYVQYPW